MTIRILRSLAVVPLALVVAAACGSGSGGKTASSPPSSSSAGSPTATTSGSQITIAGFGFGSPLTVKAGTKVTVKNNDGVAHTVTADDKSFNVSVGAGSTASFTAPSKPGTYKFHCSVHPFMHGSLIVMS